MGKISDAYYDENATNYESQRKDEKWEAENHAFSELLSLTTPQEIIDCPVGTGRWFKFYKKKIQPFPSQIRCIDISQDMLTQAKQAASHFQIDITTKRKDISEKGISRFEYENGLLVSTRFLNWFDSEGLYNILNTFIQAKPEWVILSLRYHTKKAPLKTLKRKLKRIIGRRVIYIHHDKNLTGIMDTNGYKLIREIEVEESTNSNYSYFLFEKTGNI